MVGVSQFVVCTMLIQCTLLCPVIHINTERGPDSFNYPQITTIVQGDQIQQIFENVTSVLLDKQEEKFREFLVVNDVTALPTDCQDVKTIGHTQSGVYTIYPKSTMGFPVYCDMDNGAWTVIQRRINGSVDFKRDWTNYLTGFGNPEHEYWFGNQQIHLLTTSSWYQLRIDMTNTAKQNRTALYDVFYISDAESGFRLFVDGFHGDDVIKDDLRSIHFGQKFSTFDRDQDAHSTNCAENYKGGWWYGSCHYVNLNGVYGESDTRGIHWHSWDQRSTPLIKVDMKIRRFTRR